MQTNIHANERPSRFPKQRIEAIAEVPACFAPEPPRQVAFLLRVDFRDWEIDSVILAAGSFAARSAAWRMTGRAVGDPLASRGTFLTMKSGERRATLFTKSSPIRRLTLGTHHLKLEPLPIP